MDSEYPPLPSPSPVAKPTKANGRLTTRRRGGSTLGANPSLASKNGYRKDGASLINSSSNIIYKAISDDGDVVLEYTDHSSRVAPPLRYRWQVSSQNLMRNSPYFSALLDPNKFAEGRRFEEYRSRLIHRSASSSSSGISSSNERTKEKQEEERVDSAEEIPSSAADRDDLPVVNLRVSRYLPAKHRIDILELFLKILCLNPLRDDDDDEQNETQVLLDSEIRHQPVSVIASLIDIADLFNSPRIVYDSLKRAGYTAATSVKGGKFSLTTFGTSLLKQLSEERLRQIIHIAFFLDEHATFQVLTHCLVLIGSASWVNGVGRDRPLDAESPRWAYLPNGIEEELYYRRQCVLNTITDLQAHFLRLYGGLEDDPYPPTPSTSTSTSTTTATRTCRTRPIQCRWGFSNSLACDSFHLGEMTRFFALRSKTIFLGSTLIDPGFDENGLFSDDYDDDDNASDEEEENDYLADPPPPVNDNHHHNHHQIPSSILSITALLRQIPDYQIDTSHNGCGIRRRLLPLLDCIDRFTASHGRGLLGLMLPVWKKRSSSSSAAAAAATTTPVTNPKKQKNNSNANSWMNRSLRKAEMVEIRASKIVAIRFAPPPRRMGSRVLGAGAGAGARSGSTTSVTTTAAAAAAARTIQTGSSSSSSSSPEEEARLFFTARRRNWES